MALRVLSAGVPATGNFQISDTLRIRLATSLPDG